MQFCFLDAFQGISVTTFTSFPHQQQNNIWELYHRTALESQGACAVCYSPFCRLWQQLTPQVDVTKPMSDLCWTCQQNSTLIMRAHNRPVEEISEVNLMQSMCIHKHTYPSSPIPTPHIQEIIFLNYFYLQALHRTEEHLMLVKQERSLYRNEVERKQKSCTRALWPSGSVCSTYSK